MVAWTDDVYVSRKGSPDRGLGFWVMLMAKRRRDEHKLLHGVSTTNKVRWRLEAGLAARGAWVPSHERTSQLLWTQELLDVPANYANLELELVAEVSCCWQVSMVGGRRANSQRNIEKMKLACGCACLVNPWGPTAGDRGKLNLTNVTKAGSYIRRTVQVWASHFWANFLYLLGRGKQTQDPV